jgi:hypothetical protein
MRNLLRGEIGDRFGLVFEGMRLERVQGNTVLTGAMLDQAHLHGVIERIQELGMELVSVNPSKGPQMSSQSSTPDTTVLLHGFWVTPRSWEHWIDHYQARGFRVLAPAYPGFEVEVEALNADPSPIEALTTALLHLGGVRFGVSGPVRYTMTAGDAVELCGLVRPRTAIPIHYEGWKHFREGREAIERELAAAPADVRERIRWLPIGTAVDLAA